MKIGVIAALRWEARCLQRGTSRHPDIVRTLSGIGAEAAGKTAGMLIDQGADVLISFGCAAGLDPALNSGDLLLPKQVIAADGKRLECDPDWRQRFSRVSAGSCDAALAEAPALLASRAAKAALAANTDAVAADMESAAILRVAGEHNIPAMAVRCVLDTAEQALPPGLTACCDAYGSPRPLRMTGWLMREPARLADVYALATAQRRARRTLAAIAEHMTRMT